MQQLCQCADDDSLERLLWKELEKRGISGPGEAPA